MNLQREKGPPAAILRTFTIFPLLLAVLCLAGCGAASPASSASAASSQSVSSAAGTPGTSAASFAAAHPDMREVDLSDNLTGQTVKTDLNGDGTEETLSASVEEMDTSGLSGEELAAVNHPVTVSLTVDGAVMSWDEPWNDGVSISLQTLDPAFGYQDICVLTSGTDQSYNLRLFRWNGTALWEERVLNYTDPTVFSNGQGVLYSSAGQWEINDLRAPCCFNPTTYAP